MLTILAEFGEGLQQLRQGQVVLHADVLHLRRSHDCDPRPERLSDELGRALATLGHGAGYGRQVQISTLARTGYHSGPAVAVNCTQAVKGNNGVNI